MERKKRIMSLPNYGPTNGSPDVILFMGESYEKAGASKDVLTDSKTKVAAYSPTRVTNALAVSHCGYMEAHEAPDIIQYEGASYVKADLDALEKLVGDLTALGDIAEPVATGASCALIAERIKRAIGVWE